MFLSRSNQTNKTEASAIFLPSFVHEHKKVLVPVVIAFIVVFFILQELSQPKEAQAIAPIAIAGIIAAAGGLGGLAIGTASGGIADLLRNCANYLLSVSQSCLQSLADSDLLRDAFDELIPEVYPLLSTIQTNVIIPIAVVVLLIFFVVGLFGVFRTVGETDAGIDIWKIILCYFLLAVGMLLIRNSMDIMIGIYDLGLACIGGILDLGQSSGTFEIDGISEDVEDSGTLLFLMIFSFLSMLGSVAVMGITYFTIIVRSIQLYVYTVAAPIPLAFFVSESSRSMATNFLKKYVALVITGLLLALLFIMMAAVIGSVSIATTPDSAENCIAWALELITQLIMPIAFAYCILKSGTWAQELVGAA